MRNSNARRGAVALAAVAGVVALSAAGWAEEVIAITADGRLITFDTGNPGLLTRNHPLTGVTGNVVAIDVRPADGTLYAVTDGARLYRIDTSTAVATPVGGTPFSTPIGTSAGMDFDPVTDRIRIVNDQNRNFRVNPNDATMVDGNGALPGVQEDGTLAYAFTDTNFPADPTVVAAAYTNNVSGAAATQLFGIDATLDVLVAITPDSGTLNTIGALGVDTNGRVGFDVSKVNGAAFATMHVAGQFVSDLYSVNLATGGVASLGPVGDVSPLVAMTLGPAGAVPPTPDDALVGLTVAGEIVRFQSGSPGAISSRIAVTGLLPGDTLVAIDTRPVNGRLYGLASGSRIYVINVATGLATPIRQTPFEVPLAGTSFGFDFNAATNRIRVVSDADQNLRIHPDTGGVVDGDEDLPGIQADSAVAYAAGDVNMGRNPNLVGLANRSDGGGVVTQFAIDSNLDVLVRLGTAGQPETANAGVLHTIGSLGIDVSDVVGFEVIGTTGLAALAAPGGVTRLFSIDLITGTASLMGDVGANETLLGLAAAPTGNPPAPAPDLTVKKLQINFNYRTTNRDFVTITGVLPYPAAPLEGQVVTVDLGGYSQAFFLNGLGKAKSTEDTRSRKDDDRFAFTSRPREGHVGFVVKFRREDLSDELTDEGMGALSNARREPRNVQLTITVGGVPYTANVPLVFTAKAGKSGVAKKPRN